MFNVFQAKTGRKGKAFAWRTMVVFFIELGGFAHKTARRKSMSTLPGQEDKCLQELGVPFTGEGLTHRSEFDFRASGKNQRSDVELQQHFQTKHVPRELEECSSSCPFVAAVRLLMGRFGRPAAAPQMYMLLRNQ